MSSEEGDDFNGDGNGSKAVVGTEDVSEAEQIIILLRVFLLKRQKAFTVYDT